jgi:pimeloyl-ACP methyl ester carboxylesterase
MSTLQNVVVVISLALFAVGVHDLQWWLERWDHRRHFND